MTLSLADYDERVRALLEAYRTGTPEAMARHWALTWHRRSWEGMRRYVQVDLGYEASPDIEISEGDARWLVAREHAFASWDALVAHTAALRADRTYTAKPVAVLTRSAPRGDLRVASRDWHESVEMLRAEGATGLDAHGQVTDAMLHTLPELPHITTLRLSGCGAVTDAGLMALTRLPNLETLDLSGTSISDDGLRVLASLPALRDVSLAWTRVSDAGARHLSHGAALQRVNLLGSACGDGAIETLSALPDVRELSTGASTTDDGLRHLSAFPVFTTRHHDTGMPTWLFEEALPNRLTLRGRISARGLASLQSLHGLAALDVDDSALQLRGQALAPLCTLPQLAWLSCDADDDAMPVIARMPAMRVLHCQDTSARDAAWCELGASRTLERIWGRECHGLQDDGFRALSRIPTLRALSVSCRNVSDAALAVLPAFPSLRELMPMGVPDAGYRHVAACAALESLILMYCRHTTDAATEWIAGLPALRRYFASYTQATDRTPMLLSGTPSLESVTFDSCAQLTDAGIVHLARLPRLRELRVSGARITSGIRSAFGPDVDVHTAV